MRNGYYQLLNYINMTDTHDVFYYAALNILDHLEEIPNSSIVQVADLCYASTATISRLCRRLNYASFNAFKQDIASTLAEFDEGDKLHFAGEATGHLSDQSVEQLKDAYFQEVIESLKYTHLHIGAQDLQEVVELIDQCTRVIFLGFNFTQMVSSQFQGTLAHDHKKVLGYTNEASQIELLKETKPDDLIILTTITGNYFYRKPEATSLIVKSPAKKVFITQDTQHECLHAATKCLHISSDDNVSYIGKYSVLMIFEMLELFYTRLQEEKRKKLDSHS